MHRLPNPISANLRILQCKIYSPFEGGRAIHRRHSCYLLSGDRLSSNDKICSKTKALPVNTLYCKTPEEWRDWLRAHHDKETEIWLIFYRKETGKPTLKYELAVEEALCFGWIDSIIRKVDEARYARKFSRRKDNSKWSPSNKKRIERLIREDRMAPTGLAKVRVAQENGCWDKSDRPKIDFNLPEDFKTALQQNRKAQAFFDRLAPTYQKQFIAWIRVAKRQKTIEERIRESITLLEAEKILGLR